MIISAIDFVKKKEILIPKYGLIRGKSQGLIRSLDILDSVGYRHPSSLLIPTEWLDSVISTFARSELITFKSDREKREIIIEILSSDFKSLIEIIVENFPKRAVLRSSDINEDSLENRLPGLYMTRFVGNVDDSKYSVDILNKITDICIDYIKPEKVAFRLKKEENLVQIAV